MVSVSVPIKKECQRAQCLAARRALSPDERMSASAAICGTLLKLPQLKNVKAVFSYLSTEDEVCLDELNVRLAEAGVKVAFPVSHRGGIMEAYVPKYPDSIKPGYLGIRAPLPEKSEMLMPEDFDIILVPCVGFDIRLGRLGHGGGYYDRYLSHCTQAKILCVAFDCQELDTVAADDLDVQMDLIITESRIIQN